MCCTLSATYVYLLLLNPIWIVWEAGKLTRTIDVTEKGKREGLVWVICLVLCFPIWNRTTSAPKSVPRCSVWIDHASQIIACWTNEQTSCVTLCI